MAKKHLTVCCPHVAEAGSPGALIVEGGPLTLLSTPAILRGRLVDFINAQERAAHFLRWWVSSPGPGELLFIVHAGSPCSSFIVPLDADDARELARDLAEELEDELIGHPNVRVQVAEFLSATDTASSGRRQSGERLLAPEERAFLEELDRRRSA